MFTDDVIARVGDQPITMYQAARDHSIIPASTKTLGEIGWVTEGTGFSELDKLTYHMQKEVDWHKIKAETGTQPPEKVYEDIEKLRGGRGAEYRAVACAEGFLLPPGACFAGIERSGRGDITQVRLCRIDPLTVGEGH